MFYALAKTTRLRREPAAVAVFSARNVGNLMLAHPVDAALLALLDGQTTLQELALAGQQIFSWTEETAREQVARLLAGFEGFLVASPVPISEEARRVYDPREFLYAPEGSAEHLRLQSPLGVSWLVTERCPCDCSYCCIRTLPATARPAGELTQEEAYRFLDDCVRTGVALVIFHGGEPFLRPDLPELMGFLLERGVGVSASTKMRLRESVVKRLADAGLEELQLSLDSPDPAVADRLVGREGHVQRVAHNLELLQRHGITPKINTVVTRANVGSVPELIRQLLARGVRRFSLSGYIRSPWRHDDALFPEREELEWLADEVEELTIDHSDASVDLCPLESPREISLAGDHYSGCSGGKSTLVVGAYGEVSLCDRLLPYPEALVGNVKEETLDEIWNGERLRAFLEPEVDAFEDTECDGCGLREHCDRRVRCYYRSKLITDRLFAPDYLCERMPPPPVRFF